SRFQFYASDTSGHFHPVFAASEDNFEWPTSCNSFSPRRIKFCPLYVAIRKFCHSNVRRLPRRVEESILWKCASLMSMP
ncbi:Uncharacterized protein APZ42_006410, partial [Daphnia magna]